MADRLQHPEGPGRVGAGPCLEPVSGVAEPRGVSAVKGKGRSPARRARRRRTRGESRIARAETDFHRAPWRNFDFLT